MKTDVNDSLSSRNQAMALSANTERVLAAALANSDAAKDVVTSINVGAALSDLTSPSNYSLDLHASSIVANVVLLGGYVTDTRNDTSAKLAWDSINQVSLTGVAAPATLTGQPGANGLIVGASGRRVGFFGKTPIVAVTKTTAGNPGAAWTTTALATALAKLGLLAHY
jgi:hypothetical protein